MHHSRVFRTLLALFLSIAGTLPAVAQSAPDPAHQAIVNGISLHWQVDSNGLDPAGQYTSHIDLKNAGDTALPAAGWALYFNFELNIEHLPTTAAFNIERVNGDLYRISPNQHFHGLAKGESLSIPLTYDSAILSYSQAPGGYFFVFNGTEPIALPQSAVSKLIPADQMFRGKTDKVPPSTPETRYSQNQALSLLPKDKLQPILPTPKAIKSLHGSVTIDDKTILLCSDELKGEASQLASILHTELGITPQVETREQKQLRPAVHAILIKRVPLRFHAEDPNNPADLGYELWITANGEIAITGQSSDGIFSGIQTLRQLIQNAAPDTAAHSVTLSSLHITDSPRYIHRALGLDVARNFQTKQEVLKLLDAMALYKLNVLQLHLADDEGWRLEIPGLPELTAVGGRRGFTPEDAPLEMLTPTLDSGPTPYAPGTYGSGFYTRADFIEILRHAHALHIEVIPEIEGPGHARAAIQSMLARYRHLTAAGKNDEAREYLLTEPDEPSSANSVQGWTGNIINVCIPSPMHFMDKVFTEVKSMYVEAGVPLQHVHVGGDEVPRRAWQNAAACQTLPEAERKPQALEHKYMAQLSQLLKSKGIAPESWEEAALTTDAQGHTAAEPSLLPYGLTPLAWINTWGEPEGDHSAILANAGYNVILAEASNLYFDMLQAKDPTEPGALWDDFVDTEDTFKFTPSNIYHAATADPLGNPIDPCKDFAGKPELTSAGLAHIRGLQGDVWSERVLGGDLMEYFFFPRALALAERAWAPEPKWEAACNGLSTADYHADWNRFANELGARELNRLNSVDGGFNFRIPVPGAIVENGQLKANTSLPGLAIRYTTDGSEPTASSTLYTGPVQVTGTVKLRSFDSKGRGSRTASVKSQ